MRLLLYGNPYFSNHSHHCFVGSWINSCDSRNGGDTCAQHCGLPLKKGWSDYTYCWVPNFSKELQQRPMWALGNDTIPKVEKSSYRELLHWDTATGKGQHLPLLKQVLPLGMDLPSLMVLPKLGCGLQDVLPTLMASHTASLLAKEFIS